MFKNLKLISAFVALILVSVSCSKDSDSTLMSRLPADADLAILINAGEFAKSAGGTIKGDAVTLPQEAIDLGFGDESKFAGSGLDLSFPAGWVQNGGSANFYQIYAVYDNGKFDDFLKNKGFDKQQGIDGYDFYSRSTQSDDDIYNFCALDNDFVYFFNRRTDNTTVVAEIEAAKSNPLSATPFGKYVAEGNGGGFVAKAEAFAKNLPAYLPNDLTGRICAKAKLDSDEAEIEFVLFDENGQKKGFDSAGVSFDVNAKISGDALAYLPSSECLVYALALKNVNWDAAVDGAASRMNLPPMQKMMLGMIKEYLKKIDGTVAFGIGFEGGKQELENVMNGASPLGYMPVTIVVQTASGQAKGIVGDLQALLGTLGLKSTPMGEGFSVKLPEDYGMLYVREDKNIVVLSTRSIDRYDDNGAARYSDMDDYLGSLALYLPADYPVMRDCGINDNVLLYAAADAKDSECKLKLKITGETGGGIVARALHTYSLLKKGLEPIFQQAAEKSNFTPGNYEEPDELM